MKLSVIIPTYNRADTLRLCLDRLLDQRGVEFQLIVVDDGSTDNTQQIINEIMMDPATADRFMQSGLLSFSPILQYNQGQAVARNHGVSICEGDLILFIGDDILVEPNFLKKHLEAHLAHPEENVVVLGYSTWNPPDDWKANQGPKVDVNDYMKFLEASGWQFGYGFLKPGFVNHAEPYKFFYTSNISMKKSFFEKERFDEKFKEYGWEDIELGYRLWKNEGMKLWYEPEAKAYHHHFIPESDLPKKMQAVGKSARKFQELHPEANIMPTGFRQWLIALATSASISPLVDLVIKNPYTKKSWEEFMKAAKN